MTNPYEPPPYSYEPPAPHGGDGKPLNPGLWLGLAIASTLLCCWPFGIPAIVFAAQAMGSHGRGDYHETAEKIAKARTWTFVSFGVGLAVLICYFGLVGTAVFNDVSNS